MYNKKSHIHFVGIGGIGMSGIATILKQQGYTISGCDNDICQQSVYNLKNIGCTVHQGNNAAACHDPSIDILVYSSAIHGDNPEIMAAQARGIPTIPRALMLAELMRNKYSIAIAGAHGKTTTTSLISHILMEAQMDPTVIIGGHLTSISNNARMGKGNFLVAEADESDRSFLHLHATFAVVTNIDLEHLETYRDLDDIKSTFKQFLSKVPFYGKAIVCLDDPNIQSILPVPHISLIKYGIECIDQADIYAKDIDLGPSSSTVTVYKKDFQEPLGSMTINMPGKHNVLNALAATGLALELGIPFASIAQALSNFKGIERRFTYRGSFRNAEVFDDYGHHPQEINATLAVARKRAKGRLVVVFQPHRYTRTDKLWDNFIKMFLNNPIDQLIITDIYPASESPIPGVTAENLVKAMKLKNPSFNVSYEQPSQLRQVVERIIRPDDLVLCIGAGKNVGTLAKELPQSLPLKL
jgi:UDP-N-acetylmuramate--alanine ligase